VLATGVRPPDPMGEITALGRPLAELRKEYRRRKGDGKGRA